MINNKTLLLGIIIIAVAIGMIETGSVQLMKPYLFADSEEASLILKKGNEIFVIQSGDNVIINEQVMTYRSVDMENKILIMQNSTLPFESIATIGHATGNKMKKYGFKGLLYGGLLGSTFAVIMSIDAPHYMVLTVPICAGVDAAVLGIAGAGYGYTQKTSDRTFELGPGEWEFTTN